MANITQPIGIEHFEIVQSGTAIIPAVAGANQSQSVTVTHGLGYPPIVIASLISSSTVSLMLPYGGSQVDVQYVTSQFITSSTVKFIHYEFATGGATGAFTIRYYLLREVAN